MNQTFGPNNGYMRLDVWIIANIIQLATFEFCCRFLNPREDPCGRQFDQMTQAARSGQANIAEGLARGKTSRETELKLLDVARASLAELQSDYTFWLMHHNAAPWSKESAEAQAIIELKLEQPLYGTDWTHDSCAHITQQKARFDQWLKSENDQVVANAMLLLIGRCINALNHLLESKYSEFKEQGGFTEKMSQDRLESRKAQSIESNAPECPVCGKPMLRRVARKGQNAGRPFWSCSDYPNCRGTRPMG